VKGTLSVFYAANVEKVISYKGGSGGIRPRRKGAKATQQERLNSHCERRPDVKDTPLHHNHCIQGGRLREEEEERLCKEDMEGKILRRQRAALPP